MFSLGKHLGFTSGACALLLAAGAMGATVYVDTNAPGPTHNGASWGTAYKTIVEGVTAAAANDEVWVADGTYIENVPLKSSVGIYAGFSGSESSLSERNWVTYPATIQSSGSILGSLHSAVTASFVSGATLSGFTITSSTRAGARLVECGSCLIEHCVFRGNVNSDAFARYGGGLLIDGGTTSTIRNCVFTANDALYGGGMYIRNTSPITPDPVIQNCTFSGNTPSWGQLWNIGAHPVIRNCIFDDSPDYAVVFYDTSSLPQEMSNCLLYDAPTALVTVLMSMTNYNLAQLNAQTWAEGNLEGDPAFVSRAAGNFHLTSSSPALDTGLATGAPATDRDGAPRPYDVPSTGQTGANAFDIGAYEYQGTATVIEWAVY